MHFSTAMGTQGDKAHLESRLFYPKRRTQCLQFYHYNSGGVDDQLNILVREYTAENPKGDLRLIQQISGNKTSYFKVGMKQKLRLSFIKTYINLKWSFNEKKIMKDDAWFCPLGIDLSFENELLEDGCFEQNFKKDWRMDEGRAETRRIAPP